MISLHRITAAQRGSSIPTPPTPEAPTIQASNITFTNIDRTSFTVNWERGNGEEVIVVVRSGEPITQFPIDGQDYIPNSVFGTSDECGLFNYVVYSGTDTSVNITNFKPSQEIFVRVFERNGTSYNCNPNLNNPVSVQLPEYPITVFDSIATDFNDWVFEDEVQGSPFVSGINHGTWGNPQVGFVNAPTLDISKNALRFNRANGEGLKFTRHENYSNPHEIAFVMEIIGPSSVFVRNFHVANVSEGSSFFTLGSDEQLSVNKVATGFFLPENTKFALRVHMENGTNKCFVQINTGPKHYFTAIEQQGNDTLWVGTKHQASSTFDGYMWAIGQHQGSISDDSWANVVNYYI